MSRYTVTIFRSYPQATDPNAVLGYDRMLRTYFAQAFPDEEEGCEFWIGLLLEEFPTLDSLLEAAAAQGFRIGGPTNAERLAMEREAAAPAPKSAAELLGLVSRPIDRERQGRGGLAAPLFYLPMTRRRAR